MGRAKVFYCEITVSSGVQDKLLRKHNIELWEVEEAVYDDPNAFSMSYKDCYFVYGRTYAGRYLLVLVRILSAGEVTELGYAPGADVIRIITARDMNEKQRGIYNHRRGAR